MVIVTIPATDMMPVVQLVTRKICTELLIFSMGYHCSDKLTLLMVTYSHFTICLKTQKNSVQGKLDSSLTAK